LTEGGRVEIDFAFIHFLDRLRLLPTGQRIAENVSSPSTGLALGIDQFCVSPKSPIGLVIAKALCHGGVSAF
jgi:hypothetical protein